MVDALLQKGYPVQLMHEVKETRNGSITVLQDGNQLAHSPRFQNEFTNREQLVSSFVASIVTGLEAQQKCV